MVLLLFSGVVVHTCCPVLYTLGFLGHYGPFYTSPLKGMRCCQQLSCCSVLAVFLHCCLGWCMFFNSMCLHLCAGVDAAPCPAHQKPSAPGGIAFSCSSSTVEIFTEESKHGTVLGCQRVCLLSITCCQWVPCHEDSRACRLGLLVPSAKGILLVTFRHAAQALFLQHVPWRSQDCFEGAMLSYRCRLNSHQVGSLQCHWPYRGLFAACLPPMMPLAVLQPAQ